MRKKLYMVLTACLLGSYLLAQETVTLEQHELMGLKNSWLSNTDNAAGLTTQEVPKHAVAELDYRNSGGDYHRAQEGNRLGGIHFSSERYDKMTKNWLVWGRFEFQMNREKERCWSNSMNTYNNSPYIFGDSVKGKYDLQFFDLSAKLARKLGDKWAIGMGLDYYAGDMSRMRDARTRTLVANYAATPSVIFNISPRHILGLTGKIGLEKESMTGITTVQTDPKIAYYFLVGNENANAVLNGYAGFNRQFVTMVYSGGLQYSYQNDRFSWFNNLAYTTKLQDVLGSQHESPGTFESQNVMALSSVNLKFGNKLLNATLNGFYNAGSADEFMQEKIETRNPTTGIVSYAWTTLYAYEKRYLTESYRANIDVSLRNQLNSGKDYSWLGGVDAQFDGYQNRYYLPYSQIGNQRLRVGASGSLRVFNKNDHKVTLALKGGYGFNVKKQLVLNVNATTAPVNGSSNFQRGTYRIANEVILPDMDFYSQKVIDYRVDARYTFPIKIKTSKITGMAKIYYGNQQSDTRGSWMNMGVSIGIVSL